jgi:hypothetical protein
MTSKFKSQYNRTFWRSVAQLKPNHAESPLALQIDIRRHIQLHWWKRSHILGCIRWTKRELITTLSFDIGQTNVAYFLLWTEKGSYFLVHSFSSNKSIKFDKSKKYEGIEFTWCHVGTVGAECQSRLASCIAAGGIQYEQWIKISVLTYLINS